jgi:hypothetical protein
MLFGPVLSRAMYNVGRYHAVPTAKTRDELADANDAVASLSWRGYLLSIGRNSNSLTSLFGVIHTVYRQRAAMLRDRSIRITDDDLWTVEQETREIDAALAVAVAIPPIDDDGVRRLQVGLPLTLPTTEPTESMQTTTTTTMVRKYRKPPFVCRLSTIPESDEVYDDDADDDDGKNASAAPGQ